MFEFFDLELAHERWLTLPIVSSSLLLEHQAQQMQPSPDAQRLLHHEPRMIVDKSFVLLQNYWRAIKIYVSYIHDPTLGPGPPSLSRMSLATQICRSYAACDIRRPQGRRWDEWCIFFAATVSRKMYPLEKRRCFEKMDDSGACELPALKDIIEKCWVFWEFEGKYLDGIRRVFTSGFLGFH
jgi:hypothetical protein